MGAQGPTVADGLAPSGERAEGTPWAAGQLASFRAASSADSDADGGDSSAPKRLPTCVDQGDPFDTAHEATTYEDGGVQHNRFVTNPVRKVPSETGGNARPSRPTQYRELARRTTQMSGQPSVFPSRLPTLASEKPAYKKPQGSRFELDSMAQESLLAAEQSLRRGTPLLAREHAKEALTHLAEGTDASTQSNRGTNALSAAMTAIREAPDFLGRFGEMEDTAMQRLVDSHQTMVLKGSDLSQLSKYEAAHSYHDFAANKLTEGLALNPIASRALTVIAQAELQASQDDEKVSAATQACYLRAATLCNPQDAKAFEALGRSFVVRGLHADARWALERSYALNPSSVDTLKWLATTYSALGYSQAASEFQAKSKAAGKRASKKGLVVQMAPSEFARVSHQLIVGSGSAIVPGSMENQQGNFESSTDPTPASERWPGRTARRITESVQSIFR